MEALARHQMTSGDCKCMQNIHLPSISSTLYAAFLYEHRFGSFFQVHVTRKKAAKMTFVRKIRT